MSFDLNKSDGTLVASIADGTVNNPATGDLSITVIGRGIQDYAENIAENHLHIMENFANITSPINPVAGQLWWDTTIEVLNVYDGSLFKALSFDPPNDTTKNFVEPTDIVVIGSKHQLIVYEEYIIEAGGILIIESNATLVVL